VLPLMARLMDCAWADKFIQKKRKEYADPNSSQNMHRLNDDLADIHNIMRKNIQEVLNRGERVESKFSREVSPCSYRQPRR
jgi:hypothetical protein